MLFSINIFHLNLDSHIQNSTNKASNSMIGIIRRTFTFILIIDLLEKSLLIQILTFTNHW